MKEFIDKLISRLGKESDEWLERFMADSKKGHCNDYADGSNDAFNEAISIVNELAEEYKVSEMPTGWIPCSERLPHTNDAVNITWINRKPEPYYEDIKDKPFTATGHYHNGKWYWFSSVCKDYLDEYGDSEFDRIDKDIEIVAWCELPAPYTEGE